MTVEKQETDVVEEEFTTQDTDTPETEDEEIDNDGIDTEDEDDDDEEEEEESVESMKKRLEEEMSKNSKLTEEKQKLYKKLKSWYKKWKNLKEKVESDYVSKEDVRNLLKEMQEEENAEKSLVNSYDDAKDLLPEVRRLKEEKWLDYEDAYLLVKGKVMKDEGYRNQILGKRAKNYGQMAKSSLASKADEIFGKKPKILNKN